MMGWIWREKWDKNFQLFMVKIFNSNAFLRLGWQGRGGSRAFVVSPLLCVFTNSLNKIDFGKDVTGSTLSFVCVWVHR